MSQTTDKKTNKITKDSGKCYGDVKRNVMKYKGEVNYSNLDKMVREGLWRNRLSCDLNNEKR